MLVLKLIKKLLSDIHEFILRASLLRLRTYQLAPARAIIHSAVNNLGHCIVVIMPRQSGKNELQAQLETFFLRRFSKIDADMMKASPTWKPQSLNALRRLERVLSGNILTKRVWKKEAGYIYRVGLACISFLSAAPETNIVGQTANHLLQVDEAQDVQIAKFDKDIVNMAASINSRGMCSFVGGALCAEFRHCAQLRRHVRLPDARGARTGHATAQGRYLPPFRPCEQHVQPFLDSNKKPYIHLVDGGVADNLGLRAGLERVTLLGDPWNTLKYTKMEDVHKIVFVVVNAETATSDKWDRFEKVPPFGAMLDSYSSIGIERYNMETVALLSESFPRWADEIRRGRCSSTKPISTEAGSCGGIEFYLVHVRFDALDDDTERSFLKHLPTSFVLKPEEVDKLRDAARRVLSESREFQRLLRDLKWRRLKKNVGPRSFGRVHSSGVRNSGY